MRFLLDLHNIEISKLSCQKLIVKLGFVGSVSDSKLVISFPCFFPKVAMQKSSLTMQCPIGGVCFSIFGVCFWFG
jgi:hypothetical protein